MKINQREQVLRYLQDEGSITTLDAFRELGIVRLASRICELRQSGLEITDEWEHRPNRYGDVVKFKRYRIARPEPEQKALF